MYVLTLDGGIFNHFVTQNERNLGLDKVTFIGKSLSPILKMAMRGRPMFMFKTVYRFTFFQKQIVETFCLCKAYSLEEPSVGEQNAMQSNFLHKL